MSVASENANIINDLLGLAPEPVSPEQSGRSEESEETPNQPDPDELQDALSYLAGDLADDVADVEAIDDEPEEENLDLAESEDEEFADLVEEEAEESIEEPKDESRGNKRIQKLANERKELQEENQRFQAESKAREAQMMQQMQHFERQNQALNAQFVQSQQANNELLAKHRAREEAEADEELTPAERFKKEILRESEAKRRAEFAARDQAEAQRRQVYETEMKRRTDVREQKQRLERYRAGTTEAVKSVTGGVKLAPEQLTNLENMYLSHVTSAEFDDAFGDEAKASFATLLQTAHQLEMKKRAAKPKTSPKKTKKLPKSQLAAKGQTSHTEPETLEDLHNLGYGSWEEYAFGT